MTKTSSNLLQWLTINVPLGTDFSISGFDYTSLGYSHKNSLFNALAGLVATGVLIRKGKGVYQFVKEIELIKTPMETLKDFIIANVDENGLISFKQILNGSENFFGFSNVVSLRDAKRRLIASGFLKKVGYAKYQLAVGDKKNDSPSNPPKEPESEPTSSAEFLFLSPTENTLFDMGFVSKLTNHEKGIRFCEGSLVGELSLSKEEDEETCANFLQKLIQVGILAYIGKGTKGRIYTVNSNRLDYYMGHIKVVPVGLKEKIAELLQQQTQLKTELEKAQQAVADLGRRLEINQKILSALENVAALDDATRADLLILLNK